VGKKDYFGVFREIKGSPRKFEFTGQNQFLETEKFTGMIKVLLVLSWSTSAHR
jgi:hypothetical protein